MIRVYLPTTPAGLAAAHLAGGFEAGHAAHAVTPHLREWYATADLDELEYAAFTDAAEGSLWLLGSGGLAPDGAGRRRVVVSADVDDDCVAPSEGADPRDRPHGSDGPRGPDIRRGRRSQVLLRCRVDFTVVASVHLDGDDAAAAVTEAVRVLPRATAGDDDALFCLDEAAAHDLLWYDVSEIPHLVRPS